VEVASLDFSHMAAHCMDGGRSSSSSGSSIIHVNSASSISKSIIEFTFVGLWAFIIEIGEIDEAFAASDSLDRTVLSESLVVSSLQMSRCWSTER